ncbi:MAG: hypothetical protein N4A35_00720 [Flavobacteriales bacterium]|jgi:hypothetical protein|nr:hypothetical protein [Flavobacteriales bacterium]
MRQFLTQHLSLRLKLFYRNFELGLLFWVIPAITISGITYALIYLNDFFHERPVHLLLGNISMLIWIHAKRKDGAFLKNSLTKSQVQTIYYAEYSLLSFPFLILALGCNNWIHLGIFLVILGVSFLSLSSNHNSKPLSLFKKHNIEWNSGSRLYGIAPLLAGGIYIASFFLSTTVYLNLFLLGLVILSSSSFLSIEEKPDWIRIFDCTPQQFLAQKTKLYFTPLLNLTLITTIPMIIIAHHHWPLILLIATQGLFYNLNTVLGKYANYQNEAGKIIISIVKIIFTLIPFLLPLNIILSIFLYRKAIQSLNPYLNANNQ